MRENYDFSGAVKNPFAGREKGKYKVIINYDLSAKQNESAGKAIKKTGTQRTRKPTSKSINR